VCFDGNANPSIVSLFYHHHLYQLKIHLIVIQAGAGWNGVVATILLHRQAARHNAVFFRCRRRDQNGFAGALKALGVFRKV
jgi:hypothetical protein